MKWIQEVDSGSRYRSVVNVTGESRKWIQEENPGRGFRMWMQEVATGS